MYRRNIYEQYGGYNLLQNAEFKANFSMKVFPRSNIHLAKQRLKQHGIVEKNVTHHSVNIFFKILFKKIALNSAFWNKLYPPYCSYVFLLQITKDRCSDFNQQRPPLTEGGLPVVQLHQLCSQLRSAKLGITGINDISDI